MKQNLIIRASAGTGKTFALATRFIRLMMFQRVAPERIVALTFSRAAAQEIYLKLLERLWRAAADEEGAERERAMLFAGVDAAERATLESCGVDLSSVAFREVLRRVIATQHHGTIATLDSFILRIVRSFPLEMGFQNAVDVLDGFGESQAIDDAVRTLLDRQTAETDFLEAYRLASRGKFVRLASEVIKGALVKWRDFYLTHRGECDRWTGASMRLALGIAEHPAKVDLSALTAAGNSTLSGIAAHINGYTPEQDVFMDLKTVGGRAMRYLCEHPDATVYSYATDTGREKTIVFGEAAARTLRAGVAYMLALKLGAAVDTVLAELTLCRLVEAEYDAETRRRGQLTFADFTDCQAVAEGDSEAALRIENLEFRFDSKFDHWALDEFQDTSELQWRCLRRLVSEALQPGGGRSVMAVGDLKQSIYTWRGGNDAPFMELMSRREFAGESGEIVASDISYRYEANTAEFINRVFGPENIRESGVLGAGCEPAVERWLSERCWMTHRPAEADGRPKAGDYVEVVAVPIRPAGAEPAVEDEHARTAMKVLLPKLGEFIADFWRRHQEAHSTDTVGVLVRENADGVALAEWLRTTEGVPVVWEGFGSVLDSPVVRGVLELVKLAEHPGDSFAWQTVNRLLGIRQAVFPELTRQDRVAREMARMLSRLGLARSLQEIVTRLVASARPPDARSRLMLESLVREAVGYDARRVATEGVGEFVGYLKSVARREITASAEVVRILTIHRSKGLTLDHVIVPVTETGDGDAVTKSRNRTPLCGEGWALAAMSEAEAALNPKTAAAWKAAANDRVLELLRLNYVALTRARKSTHVFICGDAHDDHVQFRDILRRPFAAMPPKPGPYGSVIAELGTMPAFGVKEGGRAVANRPWAHGVGLPRVERRSPSRLAASHVRGWRAFAGTLFAAGASASEKGTAAHQAYAAIGWIDPARPQDEGERTILASEWREAFVRTVSTTALWRERSYELFSDGVWESGQFDRVVFRGDRATIFDFKTNARGESESAADFAHRMTETYGAQMAAYRSALVSLTGLKPENVETVLLLAATMTAVRL